MTTGLTTPVMQELNSRVDLDKQTPKAVCRGVPGRSRGSSSREAADGEARMAGRPSPRNVKVLSVVSFFQDAASELVYPVLPLFITGTLGAPPSVLGLIEGVAEGTASIGKAVSGRIADRWRRKPLIAIGYGSPPAVAETADRSCERLGARALRALHRSRRQGRAHHAARRADRRRHAAGDPRPGLRVPPRGGQRGRGGRSAPGPGSLRGARPPAAPALLRGLRPRRDQRRVHRVGAIGRRRAPRTARARRACPCGPCHRASGASPRCWRSSGSRTSRTFHRILRAKDLGLGFVGIVAYSLYNLVYAGLSYAGASYRTGSPAPNSPPGSPFFAVAYLGLGLAPFSGWVWVLLPVYGAYTALTDGVARAWITDQLPQAHAHGTACPGSTGAWRAWAR